MKKNTKLWSTFFCEKDFEVVEFHHQINPKIKICPMYFELGFSPSPMIYGRYAVLSRLLIAMSHLPSTYGFIIWDIYRPRSVQATLFNWMKKEIQKKHPSLNEQEIQEETKKYMSAPSAIGDQYCPPHLSGGAVDLTLYDLSTGKELDMGTPFDDCTERAHRDYFNLILESSDEEKRILERRKVLRDAMENAGFTSYQYEWWHFDIGNIFWSRATHSPAVFGPLFGDEEWPVG